MPRDHPWSFGVASSMENIIKVRGARQHNLKNINLDIPKNQLVVFTGLSGSGKSSLAFDTIYAEGQRRYVESLSSYARQFLGVMDKPDVDNIEGLSPAISIDQKSTSHNPRSTVGTVTEIYDYMRLLFARIGHPHCPNCGREIARQSADQIVNAVLAMLRTTETGTSRRFIILSPVVRDRKGEFSGLFDNLRSKGYTRARIDGHVMNLYDEKVLIKTNKHTIEAVIDRISVSKKEMRDPIFVANLTTRLNQSIEQALNLSEGLLIISEILDSSFDFPEKPKEMQDHLYSERFACPVCNISISEIEPRSFSFNSPHGACPTCTGIGSRLKIDPDLVFNPKLSVSEGGILPFAKMFFNDTWYARLLATVAEAHEINLRIPTGQLTDKERKVLLEGTQDRVYTVYGKNRQGRGTQIYESFGGIIAELERRYSETESEFMRAEIEKFMRKELCPACKGGRLKPEALGITINKQSIVYVSALSITDALAWIKNVMEQMVEREKIIGQPIVKEITSRLGFLQAVGLDYLSLDRGANTLSGGEAQRIRLASQIGSGLSGVLYVLDEPSIGLHQRDNAKLIQTLKHLRDLGNTVIVVEHDRDIMEESDYLFDFGPGAGEHGGKIVFSGTVAEIKATKSSITGRHLNDHRLISRTGFLGDDKGQLRLLGARGNNLKNIDVSFPLGKFICVTGVSGSGKSTLVVETLYHALASRKNRFHREKSAPFEQIQGDSAIDKIILVDQSPIGRTPRSNPATYTGLFTHIRDLFAQLPDAKVRGFKPGRFSFNVKGGRCETCEGDGQIKIEMQFMADVYVTCEVCHGARYSSETLEVHYKGKNIAEVLNLTVEDALDFFRPVPPIARKLETLVEVGLSYIKLGQPAPTLSGGEAQRVKLATELSRRQTGNTVYILDEPTTGLHFADLTKLLSVLTQLAEKGNTVIVIEHNLDIIKNADHIIDLGPYGGDGGGTVVATGTPEDISKKSNSYTGQYLQKFLR